jgi:uncharacterized protein YcbX
MPHIAALTIYPFKSLDGMPVGQADVLPSGALSGDRQFALVDSSGGFVNGKRYAAVHQLRCTFDPNTLRVTLESSANRTATGMARGSFHVEADRGVLDQWLSGYFGFPCRVVRDDLYGFPDDTQAAGPTIISSATLREVANWFPELTLEEVRRRFRANMEVDDVEPFWEDRLYGEPGQGVRFRIGQVQFLGTNSCQRCVVPSRDTTTGESRPDFGKQFMLRRRDKLPPWAAVSRFDHFYRLATNTRLAGAGSSPTVRIGDPVEILG